MNNFNELIFQLQKSNIPFCCVGNDYLLCYPDSSNANINIRIYTSICKPVVYYWSKMVNRVMVSGRTADVHKMLAEIINFYIEHENNT